MVAEGSQKEAWYTLTSTKDRLEAIERVLEKEHSSVCCNESCFLSIRALCNLISP